MRINMEHVRRNTLQHEGDLQKKGCEVLSIVIMLLLLVGFYGLFASLVFFSQRVIEPDSTL